MCVLDLHCLLRLVHPKTWGKFGSFRQKGYQGQYLYYFFIEMYVGVAHKNCLNEYSHHQGPVVQSIVSLTSSLRVISLTVLADSIYNILKFFAEKM